MASRPALTFVSLSAPAAAPWTLSRLAGRIVEISGSGASAPLTVVFGLVLEAQRAGEPAAWITLRSSSFFPPDAAEGGIDLSVLAVVRVADARAAGRAADHLVRSGGFGLVVIDIGAGAGGPGLPAPLLTRLLGLAQKHETAVLVVTEKPPEAASTSSLVSLRAEARRRRNDDGTWPVEIHTLKDKRRGPGDTHVEVCRGPAGLR